MGKYLKPVTDDIFGKYSTYVEPSGLTKGQAKRKLRHAGCGRIVEVPHGLYGSELVQAAGNPYPMYGRAFRGWDRRAGGPCWVVHIEKK
ncbi:hypothetical protein ST21_012 [Aeromonas phage ST21]|uniref:Uncharacterized protein n=1 Tax=Aeromonas phage ST21 TaxID=3065691 RepID=A0AA96J198_9CAUD|nr:hypothetical protein ST21_012 [Aeromonas phage ST21]